MKKYRVEIKWATVFVLMTLTWVAVEKLAGLYSARIGQHAVLTNLIALPVAAVYALALLDKCKNHTVYDADQGLLATNNVASNPWLLSVAAQRNVVYWRQRVTQDDHFRERLHDAGL